MSDKSMVDFVSEYFKRLIFLNMPDEQFVRFCEYVDKDDLGGNMKYWRNQLLRKDGDEYVKDPATKLYVRKEVPDPVEETPGDDWQLTDAEWEKMYNEFNDAFQSMYSKKKSLEYPNPNDKAKEFLERFFGPDAKVKLFAYTTASREAEEKIQELHKLLSGPHGERLKQWFNSSGNRGQYFNDEFSWEDLIKGLEDQKYNKDPKFRQRMIDVAGALDNDLQHSDSVVRKIVGPESRLDFSTIAQGFENKAVRADKISLLKQYYRELLTTLLDKPKVFEVFPHDSSKISKSLEDAKEFLSYNNKESKSYVPPKLKDDLTLPQRISKWWDDTYENYFEKYSRFRGDHVFMSPYAKSICKAIDKEKIKPTDGLIKILESKDAIKKRLAESKNAPGHFDWCVTVLNDLKDQEPKAFASALKDGRRLRTIVSHMIIRAIRENKVEEARTAMEVLAVIRFGYTTSKVMETFRKSDLTIFSDKDFSWNQKGGEAMRFLTSAMDNTIKFAFNAIGYGITAVGNAVRLSGAKFKGQYGRLGNAAKAKTEAAEKTRTEIEKNIEAFTKDKEIQEKKLEELRNRYDPEGYLDSNIESRTKLRDEKLQPEYDKLSKELRIWLKKNSGHALHDYIEDAMTYISIGYTVDDDDLKDITEDDVREKLTRMRDLQSVIANLSDNIQEKRRKKQELEDQAEALKEYDNLIENEEKRKEELDNSDEHKYHELMAYWDFLISGKMDSRSPLSKAAKQKKADKMRKAADAFGKEKNMKESQIKFQAYYANYLKKYGMVKSTT